MVSRQLLLAGGLGLFLGGCAHSLTTTAVQKDGSCTRSVRFAWSPVIQGPDQDKDPYKELANTFVLPSGAPWRITRGRKEEETFLLAERTLPAGETAHGDVAIKESGKVSITNEATVRQISPGHWEYREVLKALDKSKAAERRKEWRDDKTLNALKDALPTRLKDDKEAASTLDDIAQDFVTILVGPPEPMLTQLILQTDLAQHLMAARLNAQVNKVLSDKYGNRLTLQERAETARKFTLYLSDSVKTRGKDFTSGPNGKSSQGNTKSNAKKDEMNLALLTFAVKMPGRITSTNGKINPATGEAFWGLYPLAAELGDVVLTASSEESKP